jgi:hypothetical protein
MVFFVLFVVACTGCIDIFGTISCRSQCRFEETACAAQGSVVFSKFELFLTLNRVFTDVNGCSQHACNQCIESIVVEIVLCHNIVVVLFFPVFRSS